MREHRGGRGVGDVVRGHVDGLDGGDGPALRGGDALLQLSHLRGEGGLVAHRGRHAAQEGRDLASRLREAEDVVDEQEDVQALVAEVLRHGEGGKRDAQARAGRLVHLAEDQAGLLEDLGVLHLLPQVVAFPRPLSDAGEDGVAAVLRGDVVDELLDDDGLAHPGAAEQPRFPAAHIGAEEIDHLDPRLEDLRLGLELGERARPPCGWASVCCAVTGPLPSTGSPRRLNTLPRTSLPTGTVIERPGVDDLRSRAGMPSVESRATARTLLPPRCCCTSLTRRVFFPPISAVDQEGVADLGKMPLLELRVEDRSDDLDHGPLAPALMPCPLRFR